MLVVFYRPSSELAITLIKDQFSVSLCDNNAVSFRAIGYWILDVLTSHAHYFFFFFSFFSSRYSAPRILTLFLRLKLSRTLTCDIIIY